VGTPKRRSKRPRPSFDVARGARRDGPAGWVYRSGSVPEIIDAPAAAVEVAPVTTARPARPITGRVESGVDLLLWPFTLSLMVLFVKLRWIIGPRTGR
jgi:hypothetical protein